MLRPKSYQTSSSVPRTYIHSIQISTPDIFCLSFSKLNCSLTEYLVWFNSLSSQCQWGEPTLRHHFYDGLPSRLKDDITKGDRKPQTLSELRQKARNADAWYWEWQQEPTQEQAHKQPQQKSQQQPVTSSSSS